MMYGCKIMVSLTLCRFFGPPCRMGLRSYVKDAYHYYLLQNPGRFSSFLHAVWYCKHATGCSEFVIYENL